MKVQLKSLRLSYFKGVKSLNVNFGPNENWIHGRNESGKTTIFDSLWFLFFGKDSSGRTDFSIKTYNDKNQVIEKVDHEVYGEFLINGSLKTFKRVYKEKWHKGTNELIGHETTYEVDDFPVRTETEYKAIVKNYFEEELFKLLTNPLFFNSMKPADRRSVLISLCPDITDDEIFKAMPAKQRKSVHIIALEKLLTEGKKLEQIKLKAVADKKNLLKEKDAIPNRIDEAIRSKPEIYDFEELEKFILEKKTELQSVEAQIEKEKNAVIRKNKAVQDWQNELFEAKIKLQKMEFQAEQELAKAKNDQGKFAQEVQSKIKELNDKAKQAQNDIQFAQEQITAKKSQINTLESLISKLTNDRAELLAEWQQVNSREFIWNGETCSACERPLEGAQALDAEEKARGRFNKNKADQKSELESKGISIKQQIEEANREVKNINETIRNLSTKIYELNEKFQEHKDDLVNLESQLKDWYSKPQIELTIQNFLSPEAENLKAVISKMENANPEEQKAYTAQLEAIKATIQAELESLHKALGNKETIERIDKRIEELKELENRLAESISDAEGMEHACFTYSKTRIEQIENLINSKFELVKFKLFHMPINGDEKEICDTIFKGVPFQDLNTAGKIQAGLDIINALSKHYQTFLPIFIDNRESVHWIPKVQSQLINLVADAEAKEIKITFN